MKNNKLMKITMSAMFAALTCVATMFFMIPLPGQGYANLGDCFVIVGGIVLGPAYGMAAAAIGSALSDLFLGYAIYAPATFIIKGLMALAAYKIYHAIKTKGSLNAVATVVSAIAAEIIMILGYFIFETPLYGPATAALDVAGNSVQGIVGIIAGTIVYLAVDKIGVFRKILY